MNIQELRTAVRELLSYMDRNVSEVEYAATQAQQRIFNLLFQSLDSFNIEDGKFVIGAPYAHRISALTREIERILESTYRPAITQYLNAYSTLDQANATFQLSYNELEVNVSKLTAARQTVYSQASYYLNNALAEAYIQPAKYILMQQVTTGATIKDAQRILRSWDAGKLSDGRLASNRPSPNLQRYSTQIARDSIYKANTAINEVIAREYGLDHFIYVGSLVEDSRALCRHIVNEDRIMSLDEMPALIKKYPQGLYPNTTKENFINVVGGFSCGHIAVPVKKR